MHFGWYGHAPRGNSHIVQFDGITWNGNKVPMALVRVQTQHGLEPEQLPWRTFRKISNARQLAGDAWDDAEEQYWKSLGGGWLAWFGHCLGYNPRLHRLAARPGPRPPYPSRYEDEYIKMHLPFSRRPVSS